MRNISAWAIAVAFITTVVFPLSSFSQALNDDVFKLPLEELMKQQVSSVSKKLQDLDDIPAAAYVITAKDIQRSGATSIPEALRLAPGIDVAAISNNKWAISIRGFSSRAADKILVLVDGRTVYPPIFPGTLWENNDIPLELIERIEVLRGAGAAIWGNNAVNGVINIITKSAHDVIGGQLSVIGGSEENVTANGIYGWALDEKTSFRVHAYSRDKSYSKQTLAGSANDSWQSQNLGFRFDKELEKGRLLVQGGFLNSQTGADVMALRFDGGVDRLMSDTKSKNAHLQLMWEHYSNNGILHTLQGFTEFASNDIAILEDRRRTLDLEYQQQLTFTQRHDIVWGVAYRLWKDSAEHTDYLQLEDEDKTSHLASLFIQDDFSLIPNNLVLTLGARLEQRTDVKAEFQPNIRLLWTPDEQNSFWGALSRSVRMPARIESASRIVVAQASPQTNGLPLIRELSEPLLSERVGALDFGWRRKWSHDFSTDAAAFIVNYDYLRASRVAEISSFPPTSLPILISNDRQAHSVGFELSSKWYPHDDVGFTLNYSWSTTKAKDKRSGLISTAIVDSSPKHKVSLQARYRLTPQVELSGFLRYVDDIRVRGLASNGGEQVIASYTELDLKLNYIIDRGNVELSLVGKNLLHASHAEFVDDIVSTPNLEQKRSVYVKLDWRF